MHRARSGQGEARRGLPTRKGFLRGINCISTLLDDVRHKVTDRDAYCTSWPGMDDSRLLGAALTGEHSMDLLGTAVVDITTLVATCHALKSVPSEGAGDLQRKPRNRLRRDLKRGAVAYIDALARTKSGLVDDALLRKCRTAAEQQMPHALAHQELLRRIMLSEAGSLDGLVAARQDLWRLAHMAVHLSSGMATLRATSSSVDTRSADKLAGRLRRRFRKALIAYARAALRTKAPGQRLIVRAREAALAEIGRRGAADAGQLADIEAAFEQDRNKALRLGVTRPLLDLALDWHHPDASAS